VIELAQGLEKARLPRAVTWQLTDAGTSVAANHRAARRARSDRELASKLAIVDEEADESVFWLELIVAVVRDKDLLQEATNLQQEGEELRAIFAKGRATLRKRLRSNER
jgi:four helix bundle protein